MFLNLLGIAAAFAGSPDTIHMVVKTPFTTPARAPIYLTGNFCQWQVNCLRLQTTAPGLYEAEIKRPQQAFEFKVSRGSWETEASDSYGHALPNYRASADTNEVVVSVVNWKDLPAFGVSGHLDLFPGFYSPQLGNRRTLRVWLPPSYDAIPGAATPCSICTMGRTSLIRPPAPSGWNGISTNGSAT